MLEKAWISGKGLLLEIWMLKAILVGSQAQIRNVSLETGGKVILVVKWQRAWLNCVLEFCGR